MPQPHIRPDVVAFFADVNWHGHLDNPQRAYHRDGRPFTLAEQRLLVTITPEEKAAGHQQIRRENEWLDEVDPMRETIDSIAFKTQAGTQWLHLPDKYSDWRDFYNRLRMWAVDGT
ncbi:hypothetical protein OG211_26380 [Streptomyces niveus]|uniref:hypothetical protein n=1 Tax=Streptomyces niveus TaxID=193462 RepID=UPI003863606E|nr:hypothetical protein OG211_26380 [Streptomyces niveus]